MPLQIDYITPKGKVVSTLVRPNPRGGIEVAFRQGVSLRIEEYAHHRFGVMFFKHQFIAHPSPYATTSFEMVERPVFDGTNKRGVVWNFHDTVPVDIDCIVPLAKGQRRRFVRARIWTTEASLESDPR